MSLVLDNSATIAWAFPDETTPLIEDVFVRVERDGAYVPALWQFEVANVLELAAQRGRCSVSFRDSTLADIAVLPIHIEAIDPALLWGATVQLAHKHRLTVYDASYLELAIRRNIPLATLDLDLRSAAHSEHVQLLGL